MVVQNKKIFVKLIDYDIKRKFKVTRNLVIKDNYDEIKMNEETNCFKKYLLDLSEIAINVKELLSYHNNYFDDLMVNHIVQLFCYFRSKIMIFDGQLFDNIKHKNSRAFLPNGVRWTEHGSNH
jgi:hypothetical protein